MISSETILRNVILASVLEPIPEKIGCTTRRIDVKPSTRFEYFQIAGVNIGWSFYNLAERIRHNSYQQPKLIYDLGYQAQKASYKNRYGGKINFGIIELLVPLITAQLVYQKDPIETIELSRKIMQNTSENDVKWHYKLRYLAKTKSSNGNDAIFINTPNVYEYFKKAPKKRDNDYLWHSQVFNGFPIIKECYHIIEKETKKYNLLDASVIAYDKILSDCINTPGIAADYTCAAIYLYLCFHPKAIII